MRILIYKQLNRFSLVVLLVLLTALLAFKVQQPTVFVIGDSISIQYGPYLKKYLEGFAGYDRKRDKGEAISNLDKPVGANGGDSKMVVKYLHSLIDKPEFYADILLINCGLHDIKVNRKTQKVQIEKTAYLNNLKEIMQLSRKKNVRLIWVNSTPVIDSIHNYKNLDFLRYNKDLVEYNALADSLFMANKVPVIDLYSFTNKFGVSAYKDHVHFKNEICDAQAKYISEQLKQILKDN